MNRSKKAALNLISQLALQLTTVICGFIVPRLILAAFGSEINGLVASVSQFLGVMVLFENGFGSVAKTAFYTPLAEGDRAALSGVYNATESFFRKVALFFATYCACLAIAFPFFNDSAFDFGFVATLVLILGLSSFMQYCFGISYTLALNADQMSFVSAFIQVFVVILNAVAVVLLIKFDASIHTVKLVSALVFTLKPIAVNLYGRHRYRVDRRQPRDTDSIAQRWDGLAQGVAAYVQTRTAYVLATVFMTFREVSVYSVYSLISTSLTALIVSLSTGFVSGLGNMYAKREEYSFHKTFRLYELVNTSVTFALFTVAAITVMPFVGVYTRGLTDADYHRPLFAFVLIIGELIYCLRLPYLCVIENAGHFRQTKLGAYVEMAVNVLLSLCLLPFLGILGLAIGMTVAVSVRTAELIVYCTRNVTHTSALGALGRILLNLACSAVAVFACSFVNLAVNTLIGWAAYAAVVTVVTLIIVIPVNVLFYREDVRFMLEKAKGVFTK